MPEIILRLAEVADGGAIARIQLAAWRAIYGHLNPAMVDALDLDRTADNWARAAVDPTHRAVPADAADRVAMTRRPAGRDMTPSRLGVELQQADQRTAQVFDVVAAHDGRPVLLDSLAGGA